LARAGRIPGGGQDAGAGRSWRWSWPG